MCSMRNRVREKDVQRWRNPHLNSVPEEFDVPSTYVPRGFCQPLADCTSTNQTVFHAHHHHPNHPTLPNPLADEGLDPWPCPPAATQGFAYNLTVHTSTWM